MKQRLFTDRRPRHATSRGHTTKTHYRSQYADPANCKTCAAHQKVDRAGRRAARLSAERHLQVVPEIVDVLDADRESD